MWNCVWDMCGLSTRSKVLAIERAGVGPHCTDMPLWEFTNYSTSHGIPDSNGNVIRSRYNAPAIQRVGNRPHQLSMPNKGLLDGIPNSNGGVTRSRDDVLAIWRVSNGNHTPSTSGNREFEQKFDPLLSGQMSSNMSQEQKKIGQGSSYRVMWHYVALCGPMELYSAT